MGAGGWLDGVRRIDSPNFDARPPGSAIELIVVHSISLPPGCYGGGHVTRLFTNVLDTAADPYFIEIAGTRVSAHVLIERDGKLTQYVSFNDRAWHAGVSEFSGRTACNDFSIGIELEGTDFEAFTDLQYESLNSVIAAMLAAYPIRAVRGHCHIAPGRKTDPGPFFDWRRIQVSSSVSLPLR
ncbi:MAG TPA: 1,6-anhydro-N-acetylmuramyl-L-alanine amidase AmpD [Burkholderiaceae bacterium]|jgi:AmpD protein|nr:1,6-anhydro-N-acetylmuramyl-L-alanine amidase AmpD [Burkholderiaceae bacterium]